MRKLTPWTLLRRRLDPLASELHDATPWRIESPATVDSWLRSLSWFELLVCDHACEEMCREAPRLPTFPPVTVVADSLPDEALREKLACQIMHRLLFALDLARRMPSAYRRDHHLTGDYAHDAAEVLIRGWRTSSALYWAREFGPGYLGDDQ